MSIPRKLRDFYVKLAADGAGYRSFVQESPAGQDEGPFTPPIERTELDSLRRHLSRAIPAGGAVSQAGNIGRKLCESLFVGEVKTLYAGSLGSIRSSGEGLRISIHLNLSDPNVAWLGQLPWELIRCDDQYLLLDPMYSLARCLDLPGPRAPACIKQPLKVLVVLANPKGCPEIDADREYLELEKSFRHSPSVEVRLVENATSEALEKHVRDETFHVVHFVGHAEFDSESGRGRFLFETDDHVRNPVYAEQLTDLLRGKATPRLLVLNACRTANFADQNGDNPWSGLATALLRAGFPAVVAMQFPITDNAAIAFSRGFYGSLAEGHDVDRAVTGGRRAIFLKGPNSLEWATPVLFLRGMEGRIFKVKKKRQRARTVVVEVHGESEGVLPQYEERLVIALSRFLKIAPGDLEFLRGEDSKHFTIKLPPSATNRLLKAAESSETELECLRAEFSISSIKTPSIVSTMMITFTLGILGNLIATWLEKQFLRDFFTLPRVATLFLLTAIFLYWDLFSRIRRRFGTKRVIATLVACAALLVSFTLPAMLVSSRSDCDGLQVSRVELDLPLTNPVALNLSDNHVTDLREQDLQGIQQLSGRAILSAPGAHCVCRWNGRTDQEEVLAELGSSSDCAFTIDLPEQYSRIYLQLQIGERTNLFVVRVQ